MKARHMPIPVCAFLLAWQVQAAGPGLPGDAEAASHGDEAAQVQLVEETAVHSDDFIFRQYNLGVLSHYSYLIGSGGEALVVDPARDIARYLKDAEELGLTIKTVYLTHSHADFVAGHMELRRAVGAEIVMNEATGAGFEHRPVRDGDEIRFGNVRGVVVTTPGHTPDGTCLYVYHPADSAQPQRILTGDTLFIGSVGRPDLLPEDWSAATLAEMGFASWRDTLSKLPDATLIFPAHGAGSLCGAHLSDEPTSTIGEQRAANPYFRHQDAASYVMAVLEGLPEAPQYFGHNARLNHDGPPLVDWEAQPVAVDLATAARKAEAGAWIVDVRDATEFARNHPRGAINIGIRGRFETWTGIMIPWGQPFLLVGSDEEIREAYFRLHRIGYAPQIQGYITGGVAAWVGAGQPVQSVELVQPAELYGQMQAGQGPIILDVRLPEEWMALRIGQVLNIPINRLFQDGLKLDRRRPVLAVCNSAYRSSLAAGILQKLGFEDVRNLDGGSEAWIEAGLPTLGAGAHDGAASAAVPSGVFVNLPEPISPEDLARRLLDLPGTFELVDIRTAAQFAEYNLPDSVNAPVGQVLAGQAYAADRRPLILVCRDGHLSASVAGVLTQKLNRPIRYLLGGVSRYHDEIARPGGIYSDSVPMPPRSTAPAPAASTPPGVMPAQPPTPSSPPPPPVPRRRSAGC